MIGSSSVRAPSDSASSSPRSEDESPTSRSGQAQAEDPLRPECPGADARDDAGVDPAGDRDDRAAAAETAHGGGRSLDQAVERRRPPGLGSITVSPLDFHAHRITPSA